MHAPWERWRAQGARRPPPVRYNVHTSCIVSISMSSTAGCGCKAYGCCIPQPAAAARCWPPRQHPLHHKPQHRHCKHRACPQPRTNWRRRSSLFVRNFLVLMVHALSPMVATALRSCEWVITRGVQLEKGMFGATSWLKTGAPTTRSGCAERTPSSICHYCCICVASTVPCA